MQNSRIIKPTFIRSDDRGGFIECLNEGPWQTVIHGDMQPGKIMGRHYHRITRCFFYLISGRATINILNIVNGEGATFQLGPQEGIYFEPFESHTITYVEESRFIFLKSLRYSEDRPDIYPHP